MKILLKGGKLCDGSGSAPFYSDILIENDRIIKIAKDIPVSDADEVCDISGLTAAPGFIDAHSHNDWFAIKTSPEKYFAPFIRQGITTFVCGNCGLSVVGFDEGCEYVDNIGGNLFFFDGTTGKHGTVGGYFSAVDKNMPCNAATLVGHCTARAAVSGNANRPLTEDELSRMLDILDRALSDGAAGISLGLMYEPGIYADINELKEVAKLCIKHGKPLTVHSRAQSAVSMAYPELLGRPHVLRALDELAEIAKGTELKLQYSHAIFVGRRSFRCKDEFIEIINRLRSEGVDVMFDIYNETVGVSVITVVLPAWYQAMTLEEKKKPANRMKLALLVKATSILLGFGFDDIEIAYIGEGYEKYEGKTVHKIAKEEGISDLDAYLKLCELSNFKGRVNMGPYTTPEIISEFEKNELCLFMTDAWVEDHGVQNPSVYNCFPKFLKDALCGTGSDLESAVRKMSGAIADRFALKDRGYLKEGFYADITVFSEEKLTAGTAEKNSSFGIEKVFINGIPTLDGETLTVSPSGGRAIPVK